MVGKFRIEDLWKDRNFEPNKAQREAILHVDGPLFLPAGPGSGKTRVLLWRTVNLVVFHQIEPKKIFLATFTEKAAFQLKEGLRSLLADVTNRTDTPYDVSLMYVGTVHSLCRRLIADRELSSDRLRRIVPSLRDELGQYFLIHKKKNWEGFLEAGDLAQNGNEIINHYFNSKSKSKSRHNAVTNCISLFNRLSEECISPSDVIDEISDPTLRQLVLMYSAYLATLNSNPIVPLTDFALLQQAAYNVLELNPSACSYFKHVIIDEYQDTNTIQEKLYFKLASGSKNLCVVGDDDQALYRFRGATVENFVQFPDRCMKYFKEKPSTIILSTNYRSRKNIVDFYNEFIQRCDWSHDSTPGKFYRIHTKKIIPSRLDPLPAVVASIPSDPESVYREIASFVKKLLDQKKVNNPNQIAFLFPSLKYDGKPTIQVQRCMEALELQGLKFYAPRARRFLEVNEAVEIIGIFLHIFGKPSHDDRYGSDFNNFYEYLELCFSTASELIKQDPHLRQFVKDTHDEIIQAISDYDVLLKVLTIKGWIPKEKYIPSIMKRALANAAGLSERAKKTITGKYFDDLVTARLSSNNPFLLEYALRRATALDWSVLDLFYRICGFTHFQAMFDLAELPEGQEDEGPICNLGLLSQYLSVFMDEYITVITSKILTDNGFQRIFFSSFLYALYRRGESEYEDADDPFPKGRIPIITVHQAKGLEFPIVVLGNAMKRDKEVQEVEKIVQPLLNRDSEPLDRMAQFDVMRNFYVALSRAQNLLVIPHFQSKGNSINQPFKELLTDKFPRISGFDISSVPPANSSDPEKVKNYSYTGDYLDYKKCPRQYMIFKKYGFVPSRTTTMVFGNLVHRTLEDLHEYLITKREHA